jgi:hypothetical protein
LNGKRIFIRDDHNSVVVKCGADSFWYISTRKNRRGIGTPARRLPPGLGIKAQARCLQTIRDLAALVFVFKCDVVRAGTQRLQPAFHPSATNEFYFFNDHAANRHRDSAIAISHCRLMRKHTYFIGQPDIWGAVLFAAQFITVGQCKGGASMKMSDFSKLIKTRLTFLVVFSASISYIIGVKMGGEQINWLSWTKAGYRRFPGNIGS